MRPFRYRSLNRFVRLHRFAAFVAKEDEYHIELRELVRDTTMRTNDAQHITRAVRECFWRAGLLLQFAFEVRSENHLAALVACLPNHIVRYLIISPAVAAVENGHISISSQRSVASLVGDADGRLCSLSLMVRCPRNNSGGSCVTHPLRRGLQTRG